MLSVRSCRPDVSGCSLSLKLIEGELRTDEALRLQAEARPADVRPRLNGRWRDWVRRDFVR